MRLNKENEVWLRYEKKEEMKKEMNKKAAHEIIIRLE